MTNRSNIAGPMVIRALVYRVELTRERLLVIPKHPMMIPIVIREVSYARH